jgi:AraC-like DNA-binding protein
MNTRFIFYRSKNGLEFHHTLTHYDDPSLAKQQAESHYMCEVFLLLKGAVQYSIEGQTYQVSPMDMIIVKPGEIHAMQMDAKQPYERMVLHFAPDLFPSFNDLDLFSPFNAAKAFAHIIPKTFVEKYKLNEALHTIKHICETPDRYVDLKLVSEVIHIATVLNDCVEELISSNDRSMLNPARVNQLSHLCIQYINEHLTENLTVHDIAEALNISVSHIRNTFKKQTHITVQNYIFNQKMQLAQKVLAQGHSPQIVAKTLGYEYYSTFYHHYQKRFHMRPKAFVNLNKQLLNAATDKMVNLANQL